MAARAASRNRRLARLRATALPTRLVQVKPTRTSSPLSSPLPSPLRRACKTNPVLCRFSPRAVAKKSLRFFMVLTTKETAGDASPTCTWSDGISGGIKIQQS